MTTQDILDQDLADYLAADPRRRRQPGDPAPDPLHGLRTRRRQRLPGRLAVRQRTNVGARGPAALRGGPRLRERADASTVAPTTPARSHGLVPLELCVPGSGA